jgi:ornithine carbamoyltransferase
MNPLLHLRLLSSEPLPEAQVQALFSCAQALRRSSEAGSVKPALRGKNIALLCSDPACKAAALFEKAATELGARVTRLPADPALPQGDGAWRQTARVLGRLYDAVECDEMPLDAAERLQRDAGVPVFRGIARMDHPLQQARPEGLDPRYLTQALLLAMLPG